MSPAQSFLTFLPEVKVAKKKKNIQKRLAADYTEYTHGLILLENLCRRMRAMVVRTAIVVHMVLPPGTSCLWE